MNVCIGANKEENPLIQCTVCRLYFHFRCIRLHPSVHIPNFTCTRCKLTTARPRNILQPAVSHCQDHVTTETNSANCRDDDMGDVFHSVNDVDSAVSKTGKVKHDDVECESDDDDCILID